MKRGYVFWEEELRVAGPSSTDDTVRRLREQLSASRFGFKERLAGSCDGSRLKVRKASSLAQVGDSVEFEGAVKPAGSGTVIEGKVRYTLATKIQFAGLLLTGLALVASGVFRAFGGDTLAAGGFILVVSLLWIYSSGRMRHEQIAFIEGRLRDAAGGNVRRSA